MVNNFNSYGDTTIRGRHCYFVFVTFCIWSPVCFVNQIDHILIADDIQVYLMSDLSEGLIVTVTIIW
jgi:hypothetical protein